MGFIYAEFWQRLTERCTRQDVNLLCGVAGVLVTAHAPLTADIVCSVLGLRAGDWEFAVRHLIEYVTVVEQEKDGVSETFYRIYHESFADFLRAKVAVELDLLRRRLGDYCLGWPHLPEGYGRAYALRFAPAHLREASRPRELTELLTSAEFVEARRTDDPADRQALIRDYREAVVSLEGTDWLRLWNGPAACALLALKGIGNLVDSGQSEQGKALLGRCSERVLASDVPELTSLCHSLAGRLAIYEGKHEEAERQLLTGYRLAKESGFEEGMASALLGMAVLLRSSGRSTEAAREKLQQALDLEFTASDPDFRRGCC